MPKAFWDRNTSTLGKRRIKEIVKATGVDEKAMSILVNSYFDFDASKHRSPGSLVQVPKKALAYAEELGVMMPDEILTHDQTLLRGVQAWLDGGRTGGEARI